jgi:hypothetical protein
MVAVLGHADSTAIPESSGTVRAWLRGPYLAGLLACCACSPGAFDVARDEVSSEAGASDGQASDAAPDPDLDAGDQHDAAAVQEPDAAESGADPEDASSNVAPEAGAICEDTARDPHNCGMCGYDCSANFAEVSCVNARCSRACDAQHDDCNRDLASGSDGDGCETRIDIDSKNCGGCDVRCVATSDGFTSCRDQTCYESSVRLKGVRAGVLHGSATGGETFQFPQLCPPNEVLVGISGVSGQGIAYSMRVHCARLALSRTSAGYALKLVPTFSSTAIGGRIGPEPPPPYDLPCPAGSVVTGVAGATWIWPGQPGASIRQISLSCAMPSVDGERRLVLTATGSVTIGDASDASAVSFADTCGAGAVAGFSGRNGAYIDAIATHCGELVIEEQLGQTAPAR